MFTEAQNFAVVQTELDTVFYQEFDYDTNFPSIATARTAEIFKPVETTHAAYIEDTFKGSPLFPIIGETQVVPLATPKVANKLTTLVKDFAQGIEISKDLFDDNMHGVWSRAVADFALKARVSQDQNAFKIFRGAFTTTLTADGNALCSTHTLLNGGTTSNTTSGAASAFSPTSLFTAIVSLRQQPDQAGVILGSVPAYLVVPTALFKHAVEITESALIADSANNNLNVYRSAYGITIYSSPYMDSVAGGSDTAWFLLAKNHSISRLIRQGIQTSLRDWSMSNNRTYFYQANFR
jgi:phage major head subunit gpT-like protein